ncbi:MAG: hypothetical protein ABR514_03710 [Chthoniobacterales bacterium]
MNAPFGVTLGNWKSLVTGKTLTSVPSATLQILTARSLGLAPAMRVPSGENAMEAAGRDWPDHRS